MKPIPVFPTILFITLCITVFYFLLRIIRAGMQQAMPARRNIPFAMFMGILLIQSIIAYVGGFWAQGFPP